MAGTSVPIGGTWFSAPQSGVPGTGTYNPQQTGGAGIQMTGNPQKAGGQGLQVTSNPMNFADPVANVPVNPGVNTGVSAGGGYDPAAAKAAADAAKAAALRGEVTNLVNAVKDIFNSRYGQVDASAGEQVGKLNERFGNESQDITKQVTDENNKLGAGYAGRGTFDSSYRGNDVDTVTHAGDSQIRDLGTELQDNIGKIAAWVNQQKAGFDAQKGGMDSVLAHLGEETDPGSLTQLRNTIDAKIADLKAGAADNNTMGQNMGALAAIAPSSARAVQLKTTLSQIVNGNADPGQKAAIGNRLISSAGLTPEETQKLQLAFQGDLAGSAQQKQQPTA
jgi:hypothetical protein